MSQASAFQPRTWRDLVHVGMAARGEEIPSSSTNSAVTFVKSFGDDKGKLRKEVDEIVLKPFGLVGRLALCNATDITKAPDLLMAMVHVLILKSCDEYKIVLECTGSDENEQPDWDQMDNWPEVLPTGWLVKSPRCYCFRYRIKEVKDCKDPQKVADATKAIFLVKGVVMGGKLVISGLCSEEGDPITTGLNIKDFVASGGDDAIEKAKKDDNIGLSGVLTRASALQLAVVVRKEILDLLLKKYHPPPRTTTSQNSTSHTSATEERRGVGSVPLMPVGGLGGGYRGGTGGFMGGLGGGDDLIPAGLPGSGGGGMLFGPGNARFDQQFGDPGRPGFPGGPGNIPGARYDPFGPPGVGPRPAPGFGGRPPRGFGGPNPDHLPPPNGSDDMYF